MGGAAGWTALGALSVRTPSIGEVQAGPRLTRCLEAVGASVPQAAFWLMRFCERGMVFAFTPEGDASALTPEGDSSALTPEGDSRQNEVFGGSRRSTAINPDGGITKRTAASIHGRSGICRTGVWGRGPNELGSNCGEKSTGESACRTFLQNELSLGRSGICPTEVWGRTNWVRIAGRSGQARAPTPRLRRLRS